MKFTRTIVACLALVAFAAPSTMPARTKSDITFAFPADKAIKIAVFRPDVQVGSLGTSGIITPNAEWTADARKNFSVALREDLRSMKGEVTFIEETPLAEDALFAEYQSLYRAVANAIFQHKFFGAKLPTKKDKFDWTLGPGTKALAERSGADYGLLFFTTDGYQSGGRKAFQLLTLNFAGLAMGGVHAGYASLVDLNTGQVVWFNVKLRTKGDPRTPEGAQERIGQLLSTLPGRPAAPTAKKK